MLNRTMEKEWLSFMNDFLWQEERAAQERIRNFASDVKIIRNPLAFLSPELFFDRFRFQCYHCGHWTEEKTQVVYSNRKWAKCQNCGVMNYL